MNRVVLEKHEQQCLKAITEMQEHMGRGMCSDYSEYKHLAGKIRGVTMSLEIIQDVLKKYEGENDEE